MQQRFCYKLGFTEEDEEVQGRAVSPITLTSGLKRATGTLKWLKCQKINRVNTEGTTGAICKKKIMERKLNGEMRIAVNVDLEDLRMAIKGGVVTVITNRVCEVESKCINSEVGVQFKNI